MILISPLLKRRARNTTLDATPDTDATSDTAPAPSPSTAFDPTSELVVSEVVHTLDWVGNVSPDIIARAAVSTALRTSATSADSRRVPSSGELSVALEALLSMPPRNAQLSLHPERPWEKDHEGAALAMLTALHELAVARQS